MVCSCLSVMLNLHYALIIVLLVANLVHFLIHFFLVSICKNMLIRDHFVDILDL